MVSTIYMVKNTWFLDWTHENPPVNLAVSNIPASAVVTIYSTNTPHTLRCHQSAIRYEQLAQITRKNTSLSTIIEKQEINQVVSVAHGSHYFYQKTMRTDFQDTSENKLMGSDTGPIEPLIHTGHKNAD